MIARIVPRKKNKVTSCRPFQRLPAVGAFEATIEIGTLEIIQSQL
jgi:hypothetical protein